jgi:hypothetical protein
MKVRVLIQRAIFARDSRFCLRQLQLLDELDNRCRSVAGNGLTIQAGLFEPSMVLSNRYF